MGQVKKMVTNRKRGSKESLEEDAGVSKRRENVAARIRGLDAEGLTRYIDVMAVRWTPMTDEPDNHEDITVRAFHNFGVPFDGEASLKQIDDAIHEHEMEAIALLHECKDKVPAEDTDRVTRCIEQIFYAKKLVLACAQARTAGKELDDEMEARLGSWSLRFRWINDEDTTTLQKLLLYLLDHAVEKRYRRHLGWCYEPIVVDGHETHAWRGVMEIKDWVYAATRKEVAWEQWVWMTQGQNARAAIEYLTNCQDHSFPVLNKNRGVFAFRNACYVAPEDRLVYFDSEDRLPSSVVACKFFDVEAPELSGGIDGIHTPLLDSIMDYQEFSPDVKRWMLILLGRLLYDVNDKDGWQVIPFFKGQASSGKSTLVLKVAKAFYETIDVGCLSNNVERKFGISAFADKLLFVAPEIKSDLVRCVFCCLGFVTN